ncbi:hypothetical protein ATO46_18595 [Aeromonas schubertii]|nr:hypothetical protein ATO46_18595 [Aeromonas schubertii]TNI66996.1 hypothetical protein CF133_22480 [Aeromonas salmonicida]
MSDMTPFSQEIENACIDINMQYQSGLSLSFDYHLRARQIGTFFITRNFAFRLVREVASA